MIQSIELSSCTSSRIWICHKHNIRCIKDMDMWIWPWYFSCVKERTLNFILSLGLHFSPNAPSTIMHSCCLRHCKYPLYFSLCSVNHRLRGSFVLFYFIDSLLDKVVLLEM